MIRQRFCSALVVITAAAFVLLFNFLLVGAAGAV
jgi:hypothetical protein